VLDHVRPLAAAGGAAEERRLVVEGAAAQDALPLCRAGPPRSPGAELRSGRPGYRPCLIPGNARGWARPASAGDCFVGPRHVPDFRARPDLGPTRAPRQYHAFARPRSRRQHERHATLPAPRATFLVSALFASLDVVFFFSTWRNWIRKLQASRSASRLIEDPLKAPVSPSSATRPGGDGWHATC